jgi:molybdopterin/thiamine biosynthesis adenylyltransferase
MGVEPGKNAATIAVIVDPSASPGRWLLATSLVDLLVRLDPLVARVVIDAPGRGEQSLAAELGMRVPLFIEESGAPVDISIGVGTDVGSTDLLVDGAGWLAAIDAGVEAEDDGNPVGPLAAAALGAGEAFKRAFELIYPVPAARLQLVPWRGVFSLYSYAFDRASPSIADVVIDATLVGTGGVGAGFLRVIAELGRRVSGSLVLVDADILTTHNLNRVSYATMESALAGALKVEVAESWLRRFCPNLAVTGYPEDFDRYRRRLAVRREDRKYDVIVTGLDNDQARWEVQRDLPRILIDGSTGKDMVARVERVEFGQYGCLGCTRRTLPSDDTANCDDPPDEHAPSLSFLSAFPGILAAGEMIKDVMGAGQLHGEFAQMFRYGPNPDTVGMAAMRDDCQVGCGRSSKIAQYRRKYPGSDTSQPIVEASK